MKALNVCIVHGYTASSGANWFTWIKQKLEEKSVPVCIPDMPDSCNPHLEPWLAHLRSSVPAINEGTILIGHSLGCVTVLRFLLEQNIPVAGVVLVSGFIGSNPMEEQTAGLQEFVEDKLDIARIKALAPTRIVLTAEDDDIVPVQASKQLAEELDAKLVVLDSGKHFIDRDGYTDFPALWQELEPLLEAQ